MPTQITFCALTGGVARWRMIELDQQQNPLTFPRQAVRQLTQRLKTGASGIRYLPFFGRVFGFTVNYAPNYAVRFDLAGEPVEQLAEAVRLGRVMMT